MSHISSEHFNNSSDTDLDTSLENQDNLREKLVRWAVKRHISHLAITDLLHILSPYHPELPLHARTLLDTPCSSHTSIFYKLETGEFCYLGMNAILKSILSQKYTQKCLKFCKVLKLSFNIDGIPLYKSNRTQLWPILGLIKNFRSDPFVISLFCGISKPKPLNIFLKKFIDELNELLHHGINVNGIHFKIEIHSFVCDAPARAYLKCTKYHSGFSSCDKCVEHGERYKNKVVFSGEIAQKRTNESFRNQTDDNHHNGLSPFLDLPIDIIKCFPIDYMHNICLGVVKKLLNTWIGPAGPVSVRLSADKVRLVSEHLVNLQQFIPLESIENLDH